MFTPCKTHGLALPTDDFWKQWRANKPNMKAKGISVIKTAGQFYILYPLDTDLSTM